LNGDERDGATKWNGLHLAAARGRTEV